MMNLAREGHMEVNSKWECTSSMLVAAASTVGCIQQPVPLPLQPLKPMLLLQAWTTRRKCGAHVWMLLAASP